MQKQITYTIDREEWTDEECENQEDRVFFITEDMIRELIHEKASDIRWDDDIDNIDITIK